MSTHRQCGGCTECCRGALSIPELSIDRGNPCPHVTCDGCSVHDCQQPDVCRDFNCGWIKRPDLFPYWMRPDKSGVIVKLEPHVWMNVPVDTIVCTHAALPKKTEKFLKKMGIKKTRYQVFEIPEEENTTKNTKVIPYGHPVFVEDYMAL